MDTGTKTIQTIDTLRRFGVLHASQDRDFPKLQGENIIAQQVQSRNHRD